MAYKRIVAAAVFAAVMAAGAVQVQAAPQAGGCRKQCDVSFSACNKRGGDQNVCLRGWHGCKKQCTAKLAAKAAVRAPGTPAPTQRGR